MDLRTKVILSELILVCTFLCLPRICITAQARDATTKVLIVGISEYQDSTIPDLPMAVRDAGLFASYIRMYHKNVDPRSDLLFYIDQQASLAGLSAGLDWLMESAEKGDTLILFYSGYAYNEQQQLFPGNNLCFYDSPAQINTSTSFNLFAQFKVLAKKHKAFFQCYGILYPLLSGGSQYNADTIQMYSSRMAHSLFENNAGIDLLFEKSLSQVKMESSEAKNSLVSYLVRGLMGQAEEDLDNLISIRELKTYFRKQAVFPWVRPATMFAAASSSKASLSKVNPSNLRVIEDLEPQFLSPLLGIETNRFERQAMQKLSEENRLLYEDFLLSVNLGHLLDTPEKNAFDLWQLMIGKHEFQEFVPTARRKLAASFQDEAQQVLNAYLNVNSDEIANRISGNVRYDRYARYLEHSIKLLGAPHYLTKILRAKKFYFEAVQKRIDGQRILNKDFIYESLSKLKEALDLENQAAFIHNEMGINYSLLGRREEAKGSFITATELSPTWSIPFANLALLYAAQDIAKAIRIAKHATRLSPQNAYGWYILGNFQLQHKEFLNAETSYRKAIHLEADNALALYNLACALSLQEKTDEAFSKLEKSLQSGKVSYDEVFNDPDFVNLRKYTIRWNDLIDKYFSGK